MTLVKLLGLTIAAIALIPVYSARGQQKAQEVVSFTDNYLEVSAVGYPPENNKGPAGYALARLAAQTAAYRDVAASISGVQLTSETEVRQLGAEVNDHITAAFRATVRGCIIVDDEETLRKGYLANGWVTVHCRVPLVGTNGVLKPVIETAANEVKKQIEQKRLPA